MKNFLKAFVTDESGASAAEYALILVVVDLDRQRDDSRVELH